jgi:hypothetical protein
MAYFEDLSDYSYSLEFARPSTLNIGWLDSEHNFNKAIPSESDLDLLWKFCNVSVAQMRGIHNCTICNSDNAIIGEHHGSKMLLGTSEIRVFSTEGSIYAAPTLIFHYVSVHHYCPPSEFISALRSGLIPPAARYFERLRELNLEWNETSLAQTDGRVFRLF